MHSDNISDSANVALKFIASAELPESNSSPGKRDGRPLCVVNVNWLRPGMTSIDESLVLNPMARCRYAFSARLNCGDGVSFVECCLEYRVVWSVQFRSSESCN